MTVHRNCRDPVVCVDLVAYLDALRVAASGLRLGWAGGTMRAPAHATSRACGQWFSDHYGRFDRTDQEH